MEYSKDIIKAKDGSVISLTFYAHASVGIEWKGINIYIDPVGKRYDVDYGNEPKADLILITHHHTDHMDIDAINILKKAGTKICASLMCDALEDYDILLPFTSYQFKNIVLYSVPAYNITSDHIKYHPKSSEGLGYVLNLGGTTIYFAGDTEDNEDVLSLKNIDVAFLPVNQPFTMTIQQVVKVINIIRPSILYPYHFGSSMGVTDVKPLVGMLNDICDVRILNMQ